MIKFVTADLTNPQSLIDNTSEDYDIVIHAAASIFAKDEKEMAQVNVSGTENLISSLVKNESNLKRFIHLSTVTVTGPIKSIRPLDENSQCFPETPYEISKHRAEELLIRARDQFGLPITILRPARVYGPNDSHSNIYNLMRLMSYHVKPIFGDGALPIDLVYIENLVEAVKLCITRRPPSPRYNITDGRPYTQEEFMDALAKAIDKKTFRIRIPQSMLRLYSSRTKAFRYLFNDVRYSCLLAEKEIGYLPAHSLHEGLKHTVKWYIDENKR